MSDHGDATWVGNAQGQMHTGSGPQYNINYHMGEGERLVRAGGDPQRVALDQRLWLKRRFVGPPGYGDAAERLDDPGSVVLISGSSGSGRRAAAFALLHHSGGRTDGFREVSLDDVKYEPARLVGGERVLFDLSAASERDFAEVQAFLATFWEKVRISRARLVVVLPWEHRHLLRSDFRQLLVSIGRPDGAGVLTRHLRIAGIYTTRTELRQSVLSQFFDGSPMRELQQLSELVVEARPEGGDFGTWAEKALAALRKRGAEVAEQIAGITDGRQRALLFAAAMLEEASAPAVSQTCDLLLATLGHPEDERPRLDRDDLTHRLRDIRVDVRNEKIRFEAFSYGAAVRAHFWLYYPDLRRAFGDWVRDVITEPAWLGALDRRRLVGRFTEQALKVGDVHVLSELVEAWTQEARLLPDAIQVLGHGLTSEEHGAALRRRIYDWSTGPKLTPNLVQVLARTCADAMAPHHPDQALVRLHHLGRRPFEEGARYAWDALLELVGRDKRLYLRLLDRLCNGLERRVPVRSDIGILLQLVDPLPDWVPSTEAVRGWRGVLAAAASSKDWEPGVRSWLSAARWKPDGGERLMRILTDAADGCTGALNRYYLLAHAWAKDSDDRPGCTSRAEVATRFCREIDRAQAVEPLIGAIGGRGL
ncbi:hypothetical protein AB0D10_09740 [Kitasatospora sp. NPDC048545]|uniref:hypothetical protein n=1 Tax=Kitasatospora sp. NPDC048545 TaxID=3157208 RepID=UPI0033C69900